MFREYPLMLVFGLLPYSKGGTNKGGIAYATYNLHYAICLKEKGSFDTHYIATDLNKRRVCVDGMQINGFHFRIIFSLFFHSLSTFLKYYKISKKDIFQCGLTRFTAFKLFCMFHYYIKMKKPDIVHVHGALAGVVLNNLNLKMKFKKIIRIHGLNTKAYHHKNYKQLINLEKEISTQTWDGFNFLSQENLLEWCAKYNVSQENKTVFNNGFDPVLFNPGVVPVVNLEKKNENKIRLLSVGVLNENKGQNRVLQAISMCKEPTRFEFICIGYDPNNLAKEMDEFAKSQSITFKYLGYISQVQLSTYFVQCDFLIQPSIMEGFGMVNIESIACGVPVIVPSDLPIAKEVSLLNEINAVIINGNDVLTITKLLENLKKKKFSSKEISETVKNRTWDAVATEYIKYINALNC